MKASVPLGVPPEVTLVMKWLDALAELPPEVQNVFSAALKYAKALEAHRRAHTDAESLSQTVSALARTYSELDAARLALLEAAVTMHNAAKTP